MLKVKQIVISFLSVFSFLSFYSQTNLVSNPSFETYTTCPVNSNQVDRAIGWDNFGNSPDYFNTCSLNPDFFVPTNWGGYQQASSGNAYCAFGTYQSPIFSASNVREYIGGQLSSLLSVGIKYYVSFKVSLSLSNTIQANCATNNVGAMFSTVPCTWNNPAPKTNNPPIYYPTKIIDTVNWTTVSGSFVADSAYKYIIIGNFFTDSNTDTLIMDGGSTCDFAYYYLDDVCVSTDSLFSLNWVGINNQGFKKSYFEFYPNPTSGKLFVNNFPDSKDCEIILLNCFGQRLKRIEILNGNYIDLTELYDGIYFLEIKSKNVLITKKIIINN